MTFVFLSFGFVSNFGFRVSRFVYFWRPLPRGIPTRPKSSCLPEALLHRESHPLFDLFLYLWIGFVYHEVHEDHEEIYNLISLFVLRALRGDVLSFAVTCFFSVRTLCIGCLPFFGPGPPSASSDPSLLDGDGMFP